MDYAEINRLNWDERAPAHAASPDYHVANFAQDPDYLSHVVRFDRPRLGDIAGLRGVHLQCHIGTDTISLARLGAHMTGLDFSPSGLTEARRIAALAGAEVDFVQADVYDAVSALGADSFDLVYTGVGALCWLPDIRRWARTVADLLRPGGRLFVREGHPMLWTLRRRRAPTACWSSKTRTSRRQNPTWTRTTAPTSRRIRVFSHNTTHTWNHGLGETIGALLEVGMELTSLDEHRSVPWEALPGHMVCDEHEEWHLKERPERLPLTYTLQARKA